MGYCPLNSREFSRRWIPMHIDRTADTRWKIGGDRFDYESVNPRGKSSARYSRRGKFVFLCTYTRETEETIKDSAKDSVPFLVPQKCGLPGCCGIVHYIRILPSHLPRCKANREDDSSITRMYDRSSKTFY